MINVREILGACERCGHELETGKFIIHSGYSSKNPKYDSYLCGKNPHYLCQNCFNYWLVIWESCKLDLEGDTKKYSVLFWKFLNNKKIKTKVKFMFR